MTNTKRYLTNCYVYLLQTCDEGLAKSYVGWTVDLDKRLAAHNDGSGAKATRISVKKRPRRKTKNIKRPIEANPKE